MRSAVHIPPLTKDPLTRVSCSTWVKNTEDSNCSQKALGNCAVSTVQPASFVALPDHNGATNAASVRAIPHSVNFVWAISFRTDDSWDIRVQRPPISSQPVHPGGPLDDSPLPNCPTREITLTERDKQVLVELRRASAMALPRCAVSRYARAWAESLEGAISGHQSWAVLCRCRCHLLHADIPKRCRQELGI